MIPDRKQANERSGEPNANISVLVRACICAFWSGVVLSYRQEQRKEYPPARQKMRAEMCEPLWQQSSTKESEKRFKRKNL